MYKELNDRLKKVLDIRGSAVAVSLSNDKPELERLNEKIRLCEMLNEAQTKAAPFTPPQKSMHVTAEPTI